MLWNKCLCIFNHSILSFHSFFLFFFIWLHDLLIPNLIYLNITWKIHHNHPHPFRTVGHNLTSRNTRSNRLAVLNWGYRNLLSQSLSMMLAFVHQWYEKIYIFRKIRLRENQVAIARVGPSPVLFWPKPNSRGPSLMKWVWTLSLRRVANRTKIDPSCYGLELAFHVRQYVGPICPFRRTLISRLIRHSWSSVTAIPSKTSCNLRFAIYDVR